jgi:transcriptional regulator with XRE-family HTH domain
VEAGPRRRELADFLRTRRTRLSLEACGLPGGGRRRTRGLRREEVAQLAGVSPSWYTKLEQGRDITVSLRFLRSLAEALRLNTIERLQLFELAAAGQAPPPTPASAEMVAGLTRMIAAMPTSPAFVMSARADYIASNAAADAVFGDYKTLEHIERNLLVNLFLNAQARTHKAWEESARFHVSVFRSAYARHADDPSYAGLVEGLLAESADFRRIWGEHELQPRSSRLFRFDHPALGEMTFEYFVFHADLAQTLRVDIFTPAPDTATREKVLRAIGRPPGGAMTRNSVLSDEML